MGLIEMDFSDEVVPVVPKHVAHSKIAGVVWDMAGTTVYDGAEREDGQFVARAFQAAFEQVMGNKWETKHPTLEKINSVMGWKKIDAILHLLYICYPLIKPESVGVFGSEAFQKALAEDVALAEKILQVFDDILVDFYTDDGNSDAREVEGTADAFRAVIEDAGAVNFLNTGFQARVAEAILNKAPAFQHWMGDYLVTDMVHSGMVEVGRPTKSLIDEIRFRRSELKQQDKLAKVGDTTSDIREGINASCALVIGIVGTRTREQLAQAANTDALLYKAESFVSGNSVVIIVENIEQAAIAVVEWNKGKNYFDAFVDGSNGEITRVKPLPKGGELEDPNDALERV